MDDFEQLLDTHPPREDEALTTQPGPRDGGERGGRGETEQSTEVALSNTSLLSPEEIDRLLGLDEPLPVAFLKQNADKMHSTDAIVDFATTVCIELGKGTIKARQSSEMRRWAELMYTCSLAGDGAQNTQVNYVGQLIQLAGVGPVEEVPLGQPDKQVIKVQDAILNDPTASRKKAQGE